MMENYTKSIMRDNFTSTTTESHKNLSECMESVIKGIDAAKDPENIDIIKLKMIKGNIIDEGVEIC
jgi:hypothetical protein